MTKQTGSHKAEGSGANSFFFPLLCFGWQADAPVTMSNTCNTSTQKRPEAKQTRMATS